MGIRLVGTESWAGTREMGKMLWRLSERRRERGGGMRV